MNINANFCSGMLLPVRMRQYLAFLLVLLLPVCGRSQLVIFNQDFNSFISYNIPGWGQQYTGIVPWRTVPAASNGLCFGMPGKSLVAAIVDCPDPAHPADPDNSNVLTYTPAINMSAVTGAWLRYDSYFRRDSVNGHVEKATVEVSTNGGVSWTVVDQVPADTVPGEFSTRFLSLNAYNNVADLRIGFRYSDDSESMMGWAIDNVQVFVPANKDLLLEYVTPQDTFESFTAINQGFIHKGRVFNIGLDTVTTFVVKYQTGANPVQQCTISNVHIPRFTTYDFTHLVPDVVADDTRQNVTAWVELANDAYAYNDSASTTIRGAYFLPTKRLVVEAGTATWDTMGPMIYTYMSQVPDTAPVSKIIVHDGDVMEVTGYPQWLYNLNQYYTPYFLLDRRLDAGQGHFFKYIAEQRNYFGFASLAIEGSIFGNQLTVNTHTTAAIDMYGDFRLAMVITEDNVTGTGTQYNQSNYYNNNSHGPMGGYESLPGTIPATSMHYDMVARNAIPWPEGDAGILPSALLHNSTYDYTYQYNVNPAWNIHKLKAIVLLMRYDDSTILNSAELPGYLFVKDAHTTSLNGSVYPNPANDATQVYFTIAQKETVQVQLTDISGRVLQQYSGVYDVGTNSIAIPVDKLPAGLYFINVIAGSGRETFKINVLH